MDHVEAVDAGDAEDFHRLVLDLLDHRGGMGAGMGRVVHHVQDRAHLVFADDPVELGRVDGLVGIVFQHHDGELDHLSGFLLERHVLEDLFNLCFHILVPGNGGSGGRLRRAGSGEYGQQDECSRLNHSFHCQAFFDFLAERLRQSAVISSRVFPLVSGTSRHTKTAAMMQIRP